MPSLHPLSIACVPQGFSRLETGAGGRGVWFHKYFVRDKPELIKHIKRVPVKNPKRTVAAPKNQLPDYTNYQLPPTVRQDGLAGGKEGMGGPSAGGVGQGPVPVHQPRGRGADGDGGLESKLSQSGSAKAPGPQDYLSAFGGQVPPGLFNPALPFPSGNGAPGRFPTSFGMPGYPQSVVSGGMNMNQFQGLSSGNLNLPPSGDLNDVAQQLMAYRNGGAPSQNGNAGSLSVNDAILARIMESRRMGGGGGGGMNDQELLSAIAMRNFFPHGPKAT